MALEVHPVTPDRWADVVDLFERRGPRGGHRNVPAYGCWCMWWRDRTLEHGEPKKRALADLVLSGAEPGLLAYGEAGPVGWASVAPREQFTALLRSPQYRPRDHDEGVWSLVCFAVDRYAQRNGVAGALLDAAVEHARSGGAACVEAYPHLSNRADYMGFAERFLAHGFHPVRETSKRVVVRKDC